VQDVVRIRLPDPHAGQQRVRWQARKINKLAAGRRWRKTTLLVAIAVEGAFGHGERWLWGAPTYDQVRIAWDEVASAVAGAAAFRRSEMLVDSPLTGGRILFRSLDDPDNARGHTADGIVLDEVADIPEAAWSRVLQPMLLDTGGQAWLIGTPKGHNWFWREFESSRDHPDHRAWQIPTLGVEITANGLVRAPHPLENPHVPFSEIERLYHSTPERAFRQELLAEFIQDEGVVFRGISAAATGRLHAQPYAGQFAIGADWGRANDFTVLTVIDTAKRSVVDFDRFNRIDWQFQLARLRAMHEKWHKALILAEYNSAGEVLVQQLQRSGLPVWGFTTTQLSKAELIESLAHAIETGQISYPPIPELLAELQAFEMSRTPSGLARYAAPEGMHDDCVMSLALAAKACRTTRLSEQPTKFKMVTGEQPQLVRPSQGGLIGEYRKKTFYEPKD
jgi:hypothetical protein